ncbi:MAG TPA: hypothetical protein VFJ19_01040 [Nocardioidaceae bacterium]|nr:hypothetical protein [Nocardioidaceae bacterium]
MIRFAEGPRDDRGTALIEVTWLSILLLVPLVYIVLAVFEVQRAAFAVTAASRAAGRAFSIAPSQDVGREQAHRAAAVALADQGLDLDGHGSLRITCRPDPDRCLTPGSVIEVYVGYPVALPLMPTALGADTPSIDVDAEHEVPYGRFREARP